MKDEEGGGEKKRGGTIRFQDRKRNNKCNLHTELVNKELSKNKGKIFAFFADLKAAFDRVDRAKLGEMLREVRIGKRLRKRIMETCTKRQKI